MQAPMISSTLKQTNEVDWITPLKAYIRQTYGDDPERYSEECATLNRLRQDMRGAGKDSAAGRDLLYRYYGQLELLDLRFPVDEHHIKISFTWYASSPKLKILPQEKISATNYHLLPSGSTLSPINLLLSTPSPTRKLRSYSISPPSCPAMPRIRTGTKTPASRQHTTPFRRRPACSRT